MRAGNLAVLILACAVAFPLEAQTTPDLLAHPSAFTLAVVPSLSLGFSGRRATKDENIVVACQATQGKNCVDYGPAPGPMIGGSIETPLGRLLGLSVGALVGRLHRTICTLGTNCETDSLSMWAFKANATLLIRLKPRVPIFFGVGAAAARFSPGPVYIQTQAVTELGAVGVIGYDFALNSHIGARVAWWNYFLQPSTTQISSPFHANSLSHDSLILFGARVKLKQ